MANLIDPKDAPKVKNLDTELGVAKVQVIAQLKDDQSLVKDINTGGMFKVSNTDLFDDVSIFE
jgi:hypothetical protein